jgi:2-dehydropantoate 2-reductase
MPDPPYTPATFMRVAVIGAGGTGGLYGGVLARAGHDVRFLARGPHLRAIQQHGLRIQSTEFGTFTVHAPASDAPADLGGGADLVLFAVKTYDVELAARAADSAIGQSGALLTLQNGLEAPDQVAAVVGPERVLIGTTSLEATIAEPGVVAHLSPFHVITVSSLNGQPGERAASVHQVLRDAGLNATLVEDGRRALWEKALLLIPMATATAACRAAIGDIRDLPDGSRLLDALVEDVSDVARASGYDLPAVADSARARLRSVPNGMKASMARDFERGGRTELESLTGAIVRMGDQLGLDVMATRSLYALLRVREKVEVDTANPLGAAGGKR